MDVNIMPAQSTTNPMLLKYPPQSVPPANSWCQLYRRNEPQINSTGAAALVLVPGGMNIAWSCGFLGIQEFTADTHIMICWHIAAVIGAIVSAFATSRIRKKYIYLFSAALTLIGGILFLTLLNEYGGVVAARYLNGFAVGLVVVPMLVLISESVVYSRRGFAAALHECGSFALGICLQAICTAAYLNFTPTYNTVTFATAQLHGIVVIICGALACLFSFFMVIESPIYYLVRNNEDVAIDCLRRLQRPFVYTLETHQQLDEHKRYMDVNERFDDLGVPALLKLCLHRGLISLAFSPLTVVALLWVSSINVGPTVTWPLVIFGWLVLLGAVIAAYAIDSAGRKKIVMIGALFCGALAIVIGAIYYDFINIYSSSKMGAVMYMLFILAFFTGFFSASSSAYLTEAFPLHLKPYYIAAAFIVEMLVLLIIGVSTFDRNSLGSYYITFGVFYVVFFVLAIFVLPETKQTTLRNAQSKFTTLLHG